MPICYVVPGFTCCELRYADPVDDPYWPAVDRLVLDGFGVMRLDASGERPAPPDGASLVSGRPLRGYWDGPLEVLQQQLKPSNYDVLGVGYDWRLNLVGLTAGLFNLIVRNVDPSDPCTIVAHSMGGLIARLTWAALLGQGKQGLVRRIITLGTPQYGTYAPIACFSANFYLIRNIEVIQNSWAGYANVGGLVPLVKQWTADELRSVCASWPALYMLFPVLGAPDAVDDPFRERLYDRQAWQVGFDLDQHWLDYSRLNIGPLLLADRTRPPPWVMTCVAGTGAATRDRLVRPGRLGFDDAIGTTYSGDGIVTLASALLPDTAQLVVNVGHHDLPAGVIERGLLAELVLDRRAPPDPVPPRRETSWLTPLFQPGPPLTGSNASNPSGGAASLPARTECGGGPCRC